MSQSYFLTQPGEADATLAFLAEIFKSTARPVIPPFSGEIGSTLSIRQSTLSVEAAAKIGYGTAFSSAGDGKSLLLAFDYMRRRAVTAADPAGIIASAIYGVGFRVAVAVTNVNTTLEASYAGIAAQAELKIVRATVNIDTIGMPGLPPGAIPPELLGFHDFGVETMSSLNATIVSLSTYAGASTNAFDPQVVALVTRKVVEDDAVDASRSVLFAAWRISRGSALKDALAAAAKLPDDGLSGDLIRSTYASLLRNPGYGVPDQALDARAPSDDDQRRAEGFVLRHRRLA